MPGSELAREARRRAEMDLLAGPFEAATEGVDASSDPSVDLPEQVETPALVELPADRGDR